MRVRLVQIPSLPSLGIYPTYRLVAAVQELVRRQFLQAKEAASLPPSTSCEQPSPTQPPPPTLLSFTPSPTFTLGRRQDGASLGAAGLKRLQAPLTVHVKSASQNADNTDDTDDYTFVPAVESSLRGGLTTYHGPGQAVLWPVFDLKSPHHRHFTVRAYSRLLETTTAGVLQRRFGLDAYTTCDPGLWVRSGGRSRADTAREERKIAALGVHLRRNIAALGVAVNLDMPVKPGSLDSPDTTPALDESTNPWARFVPCGLTGKGVTCVAEEGRLQQQQQQQQQQHGRVPDAAAWDLQPPALAVDWAAAFSDALGLGLGPDAVEVVPRDTVARWIDQARQNLAAEAGEELEAGEEADASRPEGA